MDQCQITQNTERYRAAERDCQVKLVTRQVHVATIIELGIKSLVDIYTPDSIGHKAAFDASHLRCKNCFWVVFEKNPDLHFDYDSLCSRIFYSLKKKQSVYLEKFFSDTIQTIVRLYL